MSSKHTDIEDRRTCRDREHGGWYGVLGSRKGMGREWRGVVRGEKSRGSGGGGRGSWGGGGRGWAGRLGLR